MKLSLMMIHSRMIKLLKWKKKINKYHNNKNSRNIKKYNNNKINKDIDNQIDKVLLLKTTCFSKLI